MWIFLKTGMLSVVHKDCAADELLVRARRKGDIESVFPNAKVKKTPGNDYLFRAAIKRVDVAAAMTALLMEYTADNFKDSVHDKKLKTAYSSVWGVMSRVQEIPPYATRKRSARDRDMFGDDPLPY
jgi:hypothetical protein